MALPSIEANLGAVPPVFVRKLTRKSHWGIAADPLAERLELAVEKVFPEQSGVFSVFRIETDDDLRRVALAFNANRSSHIERLDLVAFTPVELRRCQISSENVPESRTPCDHANRRHYHLSATQAQLHNLCELAMTAGRQAVSLTTATMRDVVKAAEEDGCQIVSSDPDGECICQRNALPL